MNIKTTTALLSLASLPSLTHGSIIISEVFYLGGAGTDQVEIMNTGNTAANISSWWFCARFSYQQLGALTLSSGSITDLQPGQVAVLTIDFDLNNTSSDLGLFNTASFNSTSAMEDFVQWGTSSDVGRSDVALAKGIWGTNTSLYDFVGTASSGETLQRSTGATGVADWSNAAQTLGTVNVVPEPASTALLALGGAFLIRRKRA